MATSLPRNALVKPRRRAGETSPEMDHAKSHAWWTWTKRIASLLFFAAVIALLELRYFFWSRGQYDSRIILTQLGIVAVQTLIVATLPQHFWLPVSAIVMLAGTVLLLGMLFRTRNGPSVGASSIRATGR